MVLLLFTGCVGIEGGLERMSNWSSRITLLELTPSLQNFREFGSSIGVSYQLCCVSAEFEGVPGFGV